MKCEVNVVVLSTICKDDTRRRDRHDIVIEILKTAIKGKGKTRIMYSARLSYAQVCLYLPQLVENGFLENQTIKRGKKFAEVYLTTAKGLRIIESFEKMRMFDSASSFPKSFQLNANFRNRVG